MAHVWCARRAAAFLAADPEGFFVLNVDGQPAATVSAVRYGERFGFLGLYITAPDLRGRDHGVAVWRAGREHLAGRVVGLDAVLEQETTYMNRRQDCRPRGPRGANLGAA